MDIDTLLKSTARTLYLSAKFMPRYMGKAFACAYLICRAADSIADTDLISVDERIKIISAYPRLVETGDENLLKEFKDAIPEKNNLHPSELTLLKNIDVCLAEYKTFPTLHKNMTLRVVKAVCEAMEWDLSYFPIDGKILIKATPNDERTKIYCEYMGGEPGIFWANLLLNGRKNDFFVENGKKIGMALQITNILRDLPQDIKIGRIYLPMTDLIKQELMPQDLLEKKSYKKLKPIIYKWINWGVDNIMSAKDFMREIPRWKFFSRAAVAWPVLWSLDTFLLLATSKNLLDKNKTQKISKKTIYLTMLASPLYCFSNTIFNNLAEEKAEKVRKIISA